MREINLIPFSILDRVQVVSTPFNFRSTASAFRSFISPGEAFQAHLFWHEY